MIAAEAKGGYRMRNPEKKINNKVYIISLIILALLSAFSFISYAKAVADHQAVTERAVPVTVTLGAMEERYWTYEKTINSDGDRTTVKEPYWVQHITYTYEGERHGYYSTTIYGKEGQTVEKLIDPKAPSLLLEDRSVSKGGLASGIMLAACFAILLTVWLFKRKGKKQNYENTKELQHYISRKKAFGAFFFWLTVVSLVLQVVPIFLAVYFSNQKYTAASVLLLFVTAAAYFVYYHLYRAFFVTSKWLRRNGLGELEASLTYEDSKKTLGETALISMDPYTVIPYSQMAQIYLYTDTPAWDEYGSAGTEYLAIRTVDGAAFQLPCAYHYKALCKLAPHAQASDSQTEYLKSNPLAVKNLKRKRYIAAGVLLLLAVIMTVVTATVGSFNPFNVCMLIGLAVAAISLILYTKLRYSRPSKDKSSARLPYKHR